MALTKDTEKAFKIIFCEYKRLRKAGYSKTDSIEFKDNTLYKIPAFHDWNRLDIKTALSELKEAKYISENIIGDLKITKDGIEYMESKPKEFFEDIKTLFDLASLFI